MARESKHYGTRNCSVSAKDGKVYNRRLRLYRSPGLKANKRRFKTGLPRAKRYYRVRAVYRGIIEVPGIG